MNFNDNHNFWDQVFPALQYAFQRSLDMQTQYGWDDKIVAKSMHLYCRTEQILQKYTRDSFDGLSF